MKHQKLLVTKIIALSMMLGLLGSTEVRADTTGMLIIGHMEGYADGFEINGGVFRIGNGSDGVDPPTEDVTITVGDYSVTIPGGSFNVLIAGGRQFCSFDGVIDGANVAVQINPTLMDGEFQIFADITNADVGPSGFMVEVHFSIGDDSASTRSLTF